MLKSLKTKVKLALFVARYATLTRSVPFPLKFLFIGGVTRTVIARDSVGVYVVVDFVGGEALTVAKVSGGTVMQFYDSHNREVFATKLLSHAEARRLLAGSIH